jgi:hypothetical protein
VPANNQVTVGIRLTVEGREVEGQLRLTQQQLQQLNQTQQQNQQQNQQNNQTTRTLVQTIQHYKTEILALAAAYGLFKVAAYMKDAALLAARYETLGVVMKVAGNNAGYTGTQMEGYAKGMQKLGISMLASREAAISMTAANIDMARSEELADAARNLGVVSGQNTSDTLRNLTLNIQQMDTEGLKHMGIMLDMAEATKRYKEANKGITGELTNRQKQQAFMNETMRQSVKYSGIYEESMTTAGKALGSLGRYFENIKIKLGTPLLEGFAKGVFGVTDGVKQLNVWLDELEANGSMAKLATDIGQIAGTIIRAITVIINVSKQIIEAITDMGTAAWEFFDKYLGGMDTLKKVTVAFGIMLSGWLVTQAIIGFGALATSAAAAALSVAGSMASALAAVRFFIAGVSFNAMWMGWGAAILAAGKVLLVGIATAVGAIPGATAALVIAAAIGIGYLLNKYFGDTIAKLLPESVKNAMSKAYKWVDDLTGGWLSEGDAKPDNGAAAAAKTAAAAKSEAERIAKSKAEKAAQEASALREQGLKEAAAAGVRNEAQVAANNSRLAALDNARDGQLRRALDNRLITNADYLAKKGKMEEAAIRREMAEASAAAASARAASAVPGADPQANAAQLIQLESKQLTLGIQLNAVRADYADRISKAVIESYTKEFGTVSELIDAKADLIKLSRQDIEEAGKNAEQVEILRAARIEAAADELEAKMLARMANDEASATEIGNTNLQLIAMRELAEARRNASGTSFAIQMIEDTKDLATETATLYGQMKSNFLGTEEERIRAAADAATRIAQIRKDEAVNNLNMGIIAATGEGDLEKARSLSESKKQIVTEYANYVAAVESNANAKVLQSSTGFKALSEVLNDAFNPDKVALFGDALAEAFGKGGAAVGGLIDSFNVYSKQQEIGEQARKAAQDTYGSDTEKMAKANIALSMAETRNKMAHYATVAGAAKGFFKENTTAYKVLGAAEQAFRVMEMASQVKSLYTHLFVTTAKGTATVAGQAVETGAVVAGETARNAAKVPGVYMAFMSALGPWGMAAAGVAIAAVLGGAFSGGSGGSISKTRQEEQGTGTVLGDKDAKSESIIKSMDAIKDNTYQGLTVSQGMLSALNVIKDSMGSFAALVARDSNIMGTAKKFASLNPAEGNFLSKLGSSIFGGKKTLEDTGFTMAAKSFGDIRNGGTDAATYADIKKKGGWFSSDKNSTQLEGIGAEGNRQIAAVLNALGDTVLAAGSVLGLKGDEFTTKLNSFVIDIGKVSFKDMKPDEIEATVQSIFSKLGDQMAMFAVDGLASFQKVGEGALETLTRLAQTYEGVDVVMASMGKEFGQVGMQSIAARDRLVNLSGGLDEFLATSEKFVSDFFTDAERAASMKARIQPTLDQYGLDTSSENAMASFKNVVLGLDLTTQAGAEAYALLTKIGPIYKEIAEIEAEGKGKTLVTDTSIADERKKLMEELTSVSQTAVQAEAARREAIHESNRALYDQVQIAKEAKDLNDQELALKKEINALTQTSSQLRNAERDTINAANQPLFDRVTNLMREKAVLTEAKTMQDEINKLTMTATQLRDLERTTVQEANLPLFDRVTALKKEQEALDQGKTLYGEYTTLALSANQLRAAERELIKESNLPLFDRITALQKEKAINDEAKTLQSEYNSLTLTANQLREVERRTIQEANLPLFDRITALKAEKLAYEEAVTNAEDSFNTLQSVANREKDALNKRIETERKLVDSHKQLSDALRSSISSMTEGTETLMARSVAQSKLQSTLAAVKAGGALPTSKSLETVLSTLSKGNAEMFTSQQDYLRDYFTTKNALTELADMTDIQLTAEEKSLATLESQVERLDELIKTAQEQLEAAKGNLSATMSLADAMKGFATSIATLKATPNPKDSIGSWGLPPAAPELPTDPIEALYKEVFNRKSDAEGLKFWQEAAKTGLSVADIRKEFLVSDEFKKMNKVPGYAAGGDHGGGLRLVGENGPELEVTGPSRIISNNDLMARLSNPQDNSAAVVAELKAVRAELALLRTTNSSENYSLAKHLVEGNELLDDSMYGEKPLTVKVVTQ